VCVYFSKKKNTRKNESLALIFELYSQTVQILNYLAKYPYFRIRYYWCQVQLETWRY